MSTKSITVLQVDRRQFVEALGYLVPLTGSNNGSPTITSNVHVDIKDGKLCLMATDFEAVLQVALPVEGACPGAFLIPARDTVKALRGWSEKTLTITVAPKGISFQQPGAEISLPAVDAGLFPKLEDEKLPLRFTITAADLTRTLACTVPFCETSGTRLNLSGVHVKVDREKVRWEATTGHILGQRDTRPMIAGKNAVGECLIPGSALAVLLQATKKLYGRAEVSWNDKRYRFQLDGVVLTGKLVEAKFPQVDSIIPGRAKHPCSVDPLALASAVKAATANVREKLKPVVLRLEHDKIVVGSEPGDQGQAVQVRSAFYDGPSLQIGFDAAIMLPLLKLSQGGSVDISVTEKLAATRWSFPGEPAFVAVLMPLRVEFGVPDAPAPATETQPKVEQPSAKKAAPKPAAKPESKPVSAPAIESPVETPAVPSNVVPFGRLGADRLAVIEGARSTVRAAGLARSIPTIHAPAPEPETAAEPQAPDKPRRAPSGPKQPMTPERRTQIALKAAETRRANKAKAAS